MNFLPFIETKRDDGELSPEQVRELVDAYTAGKIPDYQMSAFLMSVFFRGMSPNETRALTLAMRDSGAVLKFPEDDRPLVDKHSTGGVGDKVSIVLAPLLACLGFRVPMISGRGLGITGGTLDKLESIPGFTTQLPPARIIEQVQSIGVVMGAQTSEVAPADKALYALRDVTGTVPSIPLITASILSKKLAEGIDALVMDVKFGRAAFMADMDTARELASSITMLATECKVKTTALLTAMDTPLGRSAGNWLEVKESVDCLDGQGPEDLKELILTCAAKLLTITGKAVDVTNGRHRASKELASGRPRRKFDELIAAQGGDFEAFQKQIKQDHTAPVVRELITHEKGFIARCDARVVGEIVRDLGGGRLTKESVIHPAVGVDQLAKPGDALGQQSTLARVHARTETEAQKALARLEGIYEFADEPPELPPLIVTA